MRQKDLMLIFVVVIIAGTISFIVANSFFGAPKKKFEKVPVVEQISADFPRASDDPQYKAFFNANALNPTQLIQIGNNNNVAPFDSQ